MCETDFASYADDNTPYVFGDGIDDVDKWFEDDYINLFEWFLDHEMKVNSDKCYHIPSKQSCMNLKIGNIRLKTALWKTTRS